MYHEEKTINGVLHYRTDPRDKWTPYSAAQLTAKLARAKEGRP